MEFPQHETSFFPMPLQRDTILLLDEKPARSTPQGETNSKTRSFFYQIETLVDFSGKKTNHDLFVRTKYAMPQN